MSQYKCNKCNNRRHISLCEEEIKGDNPDNPDNTNVHFNDNRNNILLQTATGQVSSVGKNNYRKARLLFDSGSQRTYITDKLRRSLKLPKIRTENLMIQTFGNTKSDVKQFDVVQLKI